MDTRPHASSDGRSNHPRSARARIASADEDDHCFTELYTAWWQDTWTAARQVLPCDDDALDAAENVFARLWTQKGAAWREIASPKAFFGTAGRNEALKILRRRRRWAHAEGDPLNGLPSPEPGPDTEVARRELQRLVKALLARLPPRCRSVMCAIAVDGLTYAETADRLGIGIKAVEKQVARGRRLLKKMAEARWFERVPGDVSTTSDGGRVAADGSEQPGHSPSAGAFQNHPERERIQIHAKQALHLWRRPFKDRHARPLSGGWFHGIHSRSGLDKVRVRARIAAECEWLCGSLA